MLTDKTIIETTAAPRPVGPYSQAVKMGNMVFLAGQIALDPQTMKFVGTTAAEQMNQCMKNVETLVEFSGLTMGHIVRCVVYVTDLSQMQAINEAYASHFIYQPPARTTVQVAGLPGGALVEVEATAMAPANQPVVSGGF